MSAPAVRAFFVLLWSSGVIAGSIGVRHMPPLSLTAARFALSALAAAGLALALRAPWPREGRAWRELAATGLLLQALQFGGFYLGFSHGLPAAVLALMLGLNPVVTSLLARPLLGEHTSGRQWLGLALGVGGVVVAVGGGLDVDARVLAGLGFAVLGLLGLSLGTIHGRNGTTRAHPLSGLAIQLAAATVPVAVLAAATEHVAFEADAGPLASLAWLVLVNSLGATLLLFALVRRDGAARTSVLFLVMPPVTAVLAALTLDEPLTVATVAGLALAAVGLRLGLSRPAAPAASAAAAAAADRPAGPRRSLAPARRRP